MRWGGRIDRSLPYAKAHALEVLEGDYAIEAKGLRRAEAFSERHAQDHPEAAAAHAEAIRQTEAVLGELVQRIRFREPGISWRSFPDGSGHKEFPGCSGRAPFCAMMASSSALPLRGRISTGEYPPTSPTMPSGMARTKPRQPLGFGYSR